jgi:two-component system nitrate/nitrite response regulator NarL
MGMGTEVDSRPVALTAREHEILLLTADGRSAPDIARQLSVTPAVVNTDLLSLYVKLGAWDRASAVAVAARDGLLL